MTVLSRFALISALTLACIPSVAIGQNVSTDNLLRRIDSLERRTVALERRVDALEGLLRSQPSRKATAASSPGSRDLANWRRLSRGMTMDSVRALLGEPENVFASSYDTVWYYPDTGSVTFDSGRVDGWLEPSRR